METTIGPWTLVDVAVILGVALVLPPCLGHRRVWSVAALATAYACLLPAGSAGAAAFGAVWVLLALGVAAATLVANGPLLWWDLRALVVAVAAGYAVAAASWSLLSRLGTSPIGIAEPIVQLTAVHFTFVGVGASTLAFAAYRRAASRVGRRVGGVAFGLSAGAPAVVALGFVTRHPLAQVGGAVLVSLGVFATAWLQLVAARRPGPADVRVLLGISGLSVWVPMVLAVLWAASQHVEVWALGIDGMVRTHGALNAVGFVGAGLVAMVLERRRHDPVVEAAPCR